MLAEMEGDREQAATLYLRVLAGIHPAHPIALRTALRLQSLGAAVEPFLTE